MDEYVDFGVLNGRIMPKTKLVFNALVIIFYDFFMKCENCRDFRDYYFRPEIIGFDDIYAYLECFFKHAPNLFVKIQKFPNLIFDVIQVKLYGVVIKFSIFNEQKLVYAKMARVENVYECLTRSKFVHTKNKNAWFLIPSIHRKHRPSRNSKLVIG